MSDAKLAGFLLQESCFWPVFLKKGQKQTIFSKKQSA